MTLRYVALLALTLAFAAGLQAEPQPNETVSTSTSSVSTASSDEDAPPKAAEAEAPQIKLYMTDWCGFCRKTESLLKSLEVEYEAIDIEKVPGAREEKNRHQPRCGVPVTVIAEQSICGFSEQKIRQMVQDLKKESAG